MTLNALVLIKEAVCVTSTWVAWSLVSDVVILEWSLRKLASLNKEDGQGSHLNVV